MKRTLNKSSSFLFCLSYLIFLTYSLLGHIPMFGPVLKYSTYFAIIILFFSFFLQMKSYYAKELIIIFYILFIAIINIVQTEDYTLFKLIMFLITTKNLDFKRCVRFDLYSRIILVSIVIILYYIGIAPDVLSYYEGEYRHSLGFTNPNALGMCILIIGLEILYLGDMKIKFGGLLIIGLLFAFQNYYAGSRTASLVLIFATTLALILQIYPTIFKKWIVKIFIINSAFIFSAITFFIVFLYMRNNSLAIVFNELLSYRIYNISVYTESLGISLFGHSISDIGLALDNAYAYSLYGLGVISILLFIISFNKLFKVLYLKRHFPLILIMLCFTFYGISERLWLSIDYNIFMLAFRELLYKHKYS